MKLVKESLKGKLSGPSNKEVKKRVRKLVDNDPKELLLYGIDHGNLNFVKLAVEKGINLNFKIETEDDDYMVPIVYALSERQYEIAGYLFEEGANPLSMDGAPIGAAAYFGYLGILRRMIERAKKMTSEENLKSIISDSILYVKDEEIRKYLEKAYEEIS